MIAAPKILGIAMERSGARWLLNFGKLHVVLQRSHSRSDEWQGVVGAESVAWKVSIPEAIAAIEREIVAIRSAIPLHVPLPAHTCQSGRHWCSACAEIFRRWGAAPAVQR